MEWQPNEKDKQCAWELYVELLTSIATQPLEDDYGDELAASESLWCHQSCSYYQPFARPVS